jgi:hypothetical protein
MITLNALPADVEAPFPVNPIWTLKKRDEKYIGASIYVLLIV